MVKKNTTHWTFWLKVALWIVLSLPVARIAYGLWSDLSRATLVLSANPVEFMIRQTGYWGLTFLLLGLSITPLNGLPRLAGLIRVKRLVGLFAFSYLCLHLGLYIWLEQGLSIAEVIHDIGQRPFILFGMLGWTILLPLALTSNQWSQRKLGGKRWKLIHKGAYIAPLFGVLHYDWLVKIDHHLPWIFGAILLLLLSWRIKWRAVTTRKIT